MKALQRVAEEFESWGNRASFLPESRDLFMLYLAFFFAPLRFHSRAGGALSPFLHSMQGVMECTQ